MGNELSSSTDAAFAAESTVAASAASSANVVSTWAKPQDTHPDFDAFVKTIAALRAPDGCPWDKEQTHKSIASNMIEEAFEAVDAIEADDVPHMREELGDVLLQVMLQSQIAADAGEFTIDDVCADINAKMIRRHPHVFGEARAADANEVLTLWEQVKLAEKSASKSTQNADQAADAAARPDAPKGLLDGVPASFPALMQAQKISRKAAAVGFEWDTIDDVWDKVREETRELCDAYAAAAKSADGRILQGSTDDGQDDGGVRAAAEAVEMEFGDLLFSLVNVARRMGIDSEACLRGACAKFRRRWAFMELRAAEEKADLADMDADQMEALWQQAKTCEEGSLSPSA